VLVTAGASVLRSSGARGVLAGGAAAVFNAKGQCSACCGNAAPPGDPGHTPPTPPVESDPCCSQPGVCYWDDTPTAAFGMALNMQHNQFSLSLTISRQSRAKDSSHVCAAATAEWFAFPGEAVAVGSWTGSNGVPHTIYLVALRHEWDRRASANPCPGRVFQSVSMRMVYDDPMASAFDPSDLDVIAESGFQIFGVCQPTRLIIDGGGAFLAMGLTAPPEGGDAQNTGAYALDGMARVAGDCETHMDFTFDALFNGELSSASGHVASTIQGIKRCPPATLALDPAAHAAVQRQLSGCRGCGEADVSDLA
jgi:hypothetical protein